LALGAVLIALAIIDDACLCVFDKEEKEKKKASWKRQKGFYKADWGGVSTIFSPNARVTNFQGRILFFLSSTFSSLFNHVITFI
jgi:hypothetical protein